MIKLWFDRKKFMLSKLKNGKQGIYLPSRDEVLQQLGISKEQDEEMQKKYQIKTISFYYENHVIEFSKNHDVLNVGIRGWNKEIIVTYQ